MPHKHSGHGLPPTGSPWPPFLVMAMGVEYLHSIRLERDRFYFPREVRQVLRREGFVVVHMQQGEVRCVGYGGHDARAQALRVARLVLDVERCGVLVSLAATWTNEAQTWILRSDGVLESVDTKAAARLRVALEMMDAYAAEEYLGVFEAEAGIGDVRAAVRCVVREFINCGGDLSPALCSLDLDTWQFDWHAALQQVPHELWQRHGLHLLPSGPSLTGHVGGHSEGGDEPGVARPAVRGALPPQEPLMSVEYLHSARLAQPFQHLEAVRLTLTDAGYVVYRLSAEVVQFVGSGSNDQRAQALWAAKQIQDIEGGSVELALSPTWTNEKEVWLLQADGNAVPVAPEERVPVPRRVVLEMLDVDPVEAHLAVFEVPPGVEDVKQALRTAVLEFVNSGDFVEALDALDIDAGQFNWGDALTQVPDAVWQRHGLRLVPNAVPSERVVVDHNERLAE